MKIKNSVGPNAVPCDTTEMTSIQDKPIRENVTRDTIWLGVVMGTDPKARFPLTRRKNYFI